MKSSATLFTVYEQWLVYVENAVLLIYIMSLLTLLKSKSYEEITYLSLLITQELEQLVTFSSTVPSKNSKTSLIMFLI